MDFLHQAFTVPLDGLFPHESILVGLGFNLRSVNIFHVQADEPFGGKQKDDLGEHFVDFLLHTVAEAVDGNEVRFLVPGQPYIMDVAVEEFFYLAAGVDVVHIGVQDNLEHHSGMVRATAAFLI